MTEIERLRFQLSLLSLALGGKPPDREWRLLVASAEQAVRDVAPGPASPLACEGEPES